MARVPTIRASASIHLHVWHHTGVGRREREETEGGYRDRSLAWGFKGKDAVRALCLSSLWLLPLSDRLSPTDTC